MPNNPERYQLTTKQRYLVLLRVFDLTHTKHLTTLQHCYGHWLLFDNDKTIARFGRDTFCKMQAEPIGDHWRRAICDAIRDETDKIATQFETVNYYRGDWRCQKNTV